MQDREKALSAVQISALLSAKHIRPSFQRIQIYQYLYGTKLHPTADAVYSALNPAIPTLSRTTVYNTLKLFEEHGIVQSIIIEDNEMRFDADISPHIHFKCRCCGRIFDVAMEKQHIEFPVGFSADKIQLNAWGMCNTCAEKNSSSFYSVSE